MSEFIMKHKPKKPAKPEFNTYKIGDSITWGEMQEELNEFKKSNPTLLDDEIIIEIDDEDLDWYKHYGYSFLVLKTANKSNKIYEKELLEYRIKYDAYIKWKDTHKKEIEQFNKEKKTKTQTTKLHKQLAMAEKTVQDIKKKLGT